MLNISLLKGTGIVSSLTLLSRVLGFIRDLLTAHLFGAGLIADAFFVAFRIPNLLRSFVAEGAMSSAFVPVFAEENAKGKAHAIEAVRSITALLLSITLILTALGVLFAPAIIHFFAPGFGFGTPQSELCISLTRIMFPYVIFVSLVAMLNGALNSLGIFGASAWAQVWMNVVLILGAWLAFWMSPEQGVYMLSWSVLVGGFVQIIMQLPSLRKSGLSILPSKIIFSPSSKLMLKLMAPALLGATVYQFQIFANTVFASMLEVGSVSWLYYADRLIQLPIGIFSIALASVLLPALAQATVGKNVEVFSKKLVDSLRFTSFIILPLACGLCVCAEPLVQLLFQRGAFDPASSAKTASAVKAYSLGLWAISCHSMVVRAFIARKDTFTPTVIGFCSLLLTIFLSLLFMGTPHGTGALYEAVALGSSSVQSIFGEFTLGHAGLALASSMSSFFSLALLMIILNGRAEIRWQPFLRSTIISLVGSICLYFISNLATSMFTAPWEKVAAAVVSGGVSFLIVCFALRSKELTESLHLIRRKVKGSK